MAWFSSKVEVTFVDDATGESFGVTQMRPADLPESFELDTTLHLGGAEWSVVVAQPKTRAEYAKSKTLMLRLRRVETVAPNNILYSLPSICDAIPAVNGQPLSGAEFALAEDDWRQFEFISHEFAREVDEEIAKIRLIHENAAAEVGWREIHVRTKPEEPLVCNLALSDLANVLETSSESVGVTYHGAQSRIADGYSFTTSDALTVYGVAPSSKVQVIAIGRCPVSSGNVGSIAGLRSMAHSFRLDLVDWCRCARIAPDSPLFDSLLSNEATGHNGGPK